MMEVISMKSLLQALHILAAKRGDGLLPEFLAPEYRVNQVPRVANESAPSEAHQKEEVGGAPFQGMRGGAEHISEALKALDAVHMEAGRAWQAGAE